MENAFKVLNELEQEGVIVRYAIGGAMGAVFYTEPVMTDDLDVFVILSQSTLLIPNSPVYEALHRKGYREDGPFVRIDGIPVQFLPAYNALVDEAVAEALETSYGATPTRVVRAEHLAAIAAQTGREKDRQRVRMLLSEAKLDRQRLNQILERHKLLERWKQWTS